MLICKYRDQLLYYSWSYVEEVLVVPSHTKSHNELELRHMYPESM